MFFCEHELLSVWADHLMTFKNAAFGEMKRDLLTDLCLQAPGYLQKSGSLGFKEQHVIQNKRKALKP